MENCDKSIMREGRENRRLRIDLQKLDEFDSELKLSEFQLILTDLFEVKWTIEGLIDRFAAKSLEMKKTRKILLLNSCAVLDHLGLTTLPPNVYPGTVQLHPGFSKSPVPEILQFCQILDFHV